MSADDDAASAHIGRLEQEAMSLVADGETDSAEVLMRQALDLANGRYASSPGARARAFLLAGDYYAAVADFGKAETQLQTALTEAGRAGGSSLEVTIRILNALGTASWARGDPEHAAQHLQRALALAETQVPSSSSQHTVAMLLNALANIALLRNDLPVAERSAARALAIYKDSDDPNQASALQTLANLYVLQKRYDEAEQAYSQVLETCRRYHSPTNEAMTHNQIGYVDFVRNRLPSAKEHFGRALEIGTSAFGADHYMVGGFRMALAQVARAQGDTPAALDQLEKASSIFFRHEQRNLLAGSERQRLQLLGIGAPLLDMIVDLHTTVARDNPQALRLALTAVLQRRGRLVEAMVDTMGAARRKLSAEDAALLQRLQTLRAKASKISMRQLQGRTDGVEQLPAMNAEAEDLESRLAARASAFTVLRPPVTIEQVQAAIPADAALVEYVLYRQVDRPASPPGAPKMRYAAYILKSSGGAAWTDLGDADDVDAKVAALRRLQSGEAGGDLAGPSRAMHDAIIAPVLKLVAGDVKHLLVVPDGALNFISLGALQDGTGRALIDRFLVSYLTTGRDLVRPAFGPAKGRAAVFADPEYGDRVPGASWFFPRLPGTSSEADAIHAIYQDAAVFGGANATEASLKDLHKPRFLHLATHGFYLKDASGISVADSRGLVLDMPGSGSAPAVSNPLLRTGLALAGANRMTAGDQDGLLTAVEASGLDLEGTSLVILSACETGLGEVRDKEGVLGLRRSFAIAGAETVVTSIWKVDDSATRDLMVLLYQKLREGMGRAEALQAAQSSVRSKPTYSHPMYWASFQSFGDWRPIR